MSRLREARAVLLLPFTVTVVGAGCCRRRERDRYIPLVEEPGLRRRFGGPTRTRTARTFRAGFRV